MTTRRTFMSALMALPFAGAIARKAVASPRIVYERPSIVGIPHKTYLRAGIDTKAVRVYLDGEDISCACFEVDETGGWVGMFAHHYENGKIVLDEPSVREWNVNAMTYEKGKFVRRPRFLEETRRYWQFGKVVIYASCL